jgi:hypothetical protein
MSLPFAITVHSGRNPYLVHHYVAAIMYCQENYIFKPVPFSGLPWTEPNSFLAKYKMNKFFSNTLDQPIKIRFGKPVQTDMFRELQLFFEISKDTKDICSFDHDRASGLTTLVLDKSKFDPSFKTGKYKVSLVIESPSELWNPDLQPGTAIFNFNSQCVAQVKLILEKYEGSLSKPSCALKEQFQCSSQSLQWYIQDFKKTFNIK